ncbi:MAG: isocitrate lyase/phosphoenolpyruvate mutase family protein [Mesorhizobium sp.]|nr:isocitrate lyase/phosphoenolpyruvate mutase family protein [Mesorhizobium sp.]
MTDQIAKARAFHALHVKGDPVVLFNIWDPGTANIVAGAGAKALATGSSPVASAFGFPDGEQIPLDLALDNISRIAASVDLPLSVDLEGGYGEAPEIVADTVSRALAAGAIGFNFEDQIVGTVNLHDTAVQARRVAAAVAAVKASGIPAFVNARTDLFLKAARDRHDDALVDQAVARAKAYADAGADGFFAPGLADERLIGRLVEAVALPFNIIALPGVPPKATLAAAGVARISYGPVPWRRMAAWLEAEARAAIAG